jgi:hypothetical protein
MLLLCFDQGDMVSFVDELVVLEEFKDGGFGTNTAGEMNIIPATFNRLSFPFNSFIFNAISIATFVPAEWPTKITFSTSNFSKNCTINFACPRFEYANSPVFIGLEVNPYGGLSIDMLRTPTLAATSGNNLLNENVDPFAPCKNTIALCGFSKVFLGKLPTGGKCSL